MFSRRTVSTSLGALASVLAVSAPNKESNPNEIVHLRFRCLRYPEALAKPGHKPILELVAVADSGMTVEAYDKTCSPPHMKNKTRRPGVRKAQG